MKLKILRNVIGLMVKLSIIPYMLYVSPRVLLYNIPGPQFSFFSGFLIIIGLAGMMISDLLILRFGDGSLHFSTNNSRLVDVGFYARTRHPFLWFFSIYQYGVFTIFWGFSWVILLMSLALSLIFLLWLLLVQEFSLARSQGERYLAYKNKTPFWYWRVKIPENQQVKLRPQLVWLFGMLVLRFWYRIRVEGRENIPQDRPFLVVANHESYLDPFLFGIFVPAEIKFVTTADIFATPIMRFLLKGTGSFPMRRHRQDLKSIRTMIRMVSQGQVVCIFPEGGRSLDGSPLPILTETLKLIQRCKVPILPVHIDGAYEIWPRWATNRRRGRVSISFRPVIPRDEQNALDALERQIHASIFAKNKVFRKVKSGAITRGMDQLLWACYKCRARNTIEVLSGDTIHCSACDTKWCVSDTYQYTVEGESQSISSIQWIDNIEYDILAYPLDNTTLFPLEEDEKIHLSAQVLNYSDEKNTLEGNDLSLSLTSSRMVLTQNGAVVQSWDMDTITIFTMDYFHSISIGVAGVRHSFKLPHDEIPLKWQTYFDTLKQISGNHVTTNI